MVEWPRRLRAARSPLTLKDSTRTALDGLLLRAAGAPASIAATCRQASGG